MPLQCPLFIVQSFSRFLSFIMLVQSDRFTVPFRDKQLPCPSTDSAGTVSILFLQPRPLFFPSHESHIYTGCISTSIKALTLDKSFCLSLSLSLLISSNNTSQEETEREYTVDPWTTQVWTVLLLTHFHYICTTVPHHLGLVESTHVKLQI